MSKHKRHKKLSLKLVSGFNLNRYRFLLIIGLSVAIGVSAAAMYVLSIPEQTARADHRLPSEDGPGNTNQQYVEVSRQGNGNALDAEVANFKFSYSRFTPGNHLEIDILDGAYNNGNTGQDDYTDRWPDSPSAPRGCNSRARENVVVFQFYRQNPQGQRGGLMGRRESHQLRCGIGPNDWSNIRFRQDEVGPYVNDRYVIFMRVSWECSFPQCQGGVNAFQLRVAQRDAKASHDSRDYGGPGDDRPFALQNREGPQGSNDEFQFKFKPPCNFENRQVDLRWFDADHAGVPGASPADAGINFDLIEYDQDGNETGRWSRGGQRPDGIGGNGNDDRRPLSFFAQRNKRYKWIWRSVERDNGLQVWVPFDSYNYDLEVCEGFELRATLRAPTGQPQHLDTVRPGQVIRLIPGLKNNGYQVTDRAALEVPLPPGAERVNEERSRHPNRDEPNDNGFNSFCQYNYDYVPGCNEPHWFWRYTSIAPKDSRNDSDETGFRFRIADDASGRVCFTAYVAKKNERGNYDPSPQICYNVDNPRYPFLTTRAGDVHAGGGLYNFQNDLNRNCDTGTGNVRGRVDSILNLGSSAEFVLSANATINRFGSAGLANSAALTFGNAPSLGLYGRVCRPNLAEAAQAYISRTGKLETGGRFLADASDGIIGNSGIIGEGEIAVVDGPFAIPRPITIATRFTLLVNNSVTIRGNITYDLGTPRSRSQLPSFGLIATGNILIEPDVEQLHGFYYAQPEDADGNPIGAATINTCNTPNNSPSACASSLQVLGFMMADKFEFRRTSGDVKANSPAEQVDFTGLLYVATPPGFSNFISSAEYSGERPPLY